MTWSGPLKAFAMLAKVLSRLTFRLPPPITSEAAELIATAVTYNRMLSDIIFEQHYNIGNK